VAPGALGSQRMGGATSPMVVGTDVVYPDVNGDGAVGWVSLHMVR